jgi:hypothetical protein
MIADAILSMLQERRPNMVSGRLPVWLAISPFGSCCCRPGRAGLFRKAAQKRWLYWSGLRQHCAGGSNG